MPAERLHRWLGQDTWLAPTETRGAERKPDTVNARGGPDRPSPSQADSFRYGVAIQFSVLASTSVSFRLATFHSPLSHTCPVVRARLAAGSGVAPE